MADDDDARPRAGDEALELLQAVEVEVVGGLVEQEDVVAADSSSAARPTRAACPPESAGHRGVEVDPGPRSAATTSAARSSRSAPPRASHRSSASAVGVVGARRVPAASASVAAVERRLRGRRPRCAGRATARTVSPGRRSCSCGR